MLTSTRSLFGSLIYTSDIWNKGLGCIVPFWGDVRVVRVGGASCTNVIDDDIRTGFAGASTDMGVLQVHRWVAGDVERVACGIVGKAKENDESETSVQKEPVTRNIDTCQWALRQPP